MAVKILYTGPYRHAGSGYSRAVADNIIALEAAGAEVACRPICLAPAGPPVYSRLAELEGRTFDSIDIVVQHVVPQAFSYCGEAGTNAGLFYFETHPLPPNLVQRACLMDRLVFPARERVEQFKTSPGYSPATAVAFCPLPCDISRYTRSYPRVGRFEAFRDGGRFLFYTVGELARRKNLAGLLRAFFAEFRPHEPVGLVVKASLPGEAPDGVRSLVQKTCREVTRLGGFADTPPVFVVPERLPEDEMMALHLACDVFVQPSFGEDWSYPCFDSMAFGKTPIVTATGGFLEYVDDAVGWLVPGRREPVYGEGGPYGELFAGDHTWYSPDPLRLQDCMRRAYEDRTVREDKAACGFERAGQFSHEAVGPRLLRALTEDVEPESGRPPGRLAEGP